MLFLVGHPILVARAPAVQLLAGGSKAVKLAGGGRTVKALSARADIAVVPSCTAFQNDREVARRSL
jgi:hypothetical protein